MPIRSRLMFVTSPLVRSLVGLDTPNRLELARYLAASPPEQLVRAFIERPVAPTAGRPGEQAGASEERWRSDDAAGAEPARAEDARQERISLSYELQLFVRTAFSFPRFVDPELVGAYAADKGLDPAAVRQLHRTVQELRDRDRGRAVASFEDLDLDERAPVVEQVRALLGAAQPPQAAVSWQPTCDDDEGSGIDALIELAFGGDVALHEARDLTQPEAWPEIFEGAWLEVLALAPWQIDSFPDAPNVVGRSTTIAEVVNLPRPFDEAVRLSVSQIEHRPTGSDDVDDRALIYSLDAPNGALTDDAGIVLQSRLGWPTLDPIEHWTGLVLKSLTYRSTSYASLTQLVCDRWRHLIERAIA